MTVTPGQSPGVTTRAGASDPGLSAGFSTENRSLDGARSPQGCVSRYGPHNALGGRSLKAVTYRSWSWPESGHTPTAAASFSGTMSVARSTPVGDAFAADEREGRLRRNRWRSVSRIRNTQGLDNGGPHRSTREAPVHPSRAAAPGP